MRPYTRSLHTDDYAFLAHAEPLRLFEADMVRAGVPRRENHPHRFWEYASIMQQLTELDVSNELSLIDVGSGGSFFPVYLATAGGYPDVSLTDSMIYGDISWMIDAQRAYFHIGLPLYVLKAENMMTIEDESFDVVMCISTIEHVPAMYHDAALHELWRIAKPGGYIFITSDYFRDPLQLAASPWREYQYTPYTKEFVLGIPNKIEADFVGDTDLDYRGDFVHNYSFVNICLRKKGWRPPCPG